MNRRRSAFRQTILLGALILVGGSSCRLNAFLPVHHGGLIREAFLMVKEANDLAAVDMAVEESTRVDKQENDEADQYKHSMRPAGLSLADSQAKARQYYKTYLDAAVQSALRGDRKAAGQALGRLLHLVQDEKHQWCSCGSTSNITDSQDDCAAQGTCTGPGFGNHALKDCRKLGLEANPFRQFQLKTDIRPVQSQTTLARNASVHVLNDFVAAVSQTKSKPHGTP